MTQPAQKRATPPQSTEQRGEKTGRYAIDDVRRGTVLPPPSAQAELVSLEELGAVLETETTTSRTKPPPTPRGLVSGVFASRGLASQQPVAEGQRFEGPALEALSESLQPFYRPDETQGERAVLEIEDCSLRMDNPYIASSLVPPAKRASGARPTIALVSGALVLVLGSAAAWLLLRAPTGEPAQRPVAARAPALSPQTVAGEEATEVAEPVAPAPEQTAAAPSDARRPIDPPPAPVGVPVAAEPKIDSPARAPKPVEVAAVEAKTVGPAVVSPALPASSATAGVASPAATPAADPAALAAALPESPTRAEVTAGFQAIHDQLVQCAAGKHGVAKVAVTIANSGRVSSALIEGQFQGLPEGSCMARAVRSARFPQFSQPSLKVTYPIAF